MAHGDQATLLLPKNIRQIGILGDHYRVYIEDFVYTYVHQYIHKQKKEDTVLSAVLLGETIVQGDQEYIFISGAQKVDFQTETNTETTDTSEANTSMIQTPAMKQQQFWEKVYQGIKQYFDEKEIVGWYFNLDGGNLEINSQLQQFFESTYKKGSRFLYYEDSIEKTDAFFIQDQHKLQRLSGYAVYYEKNPQMQEFMISEREFNRRKLTAEWKSEEDQERDAAKNYRLLMNKINEKTDKRKVQPVAYVLGAIVLVVVAATGVTQIGNYQNLKVLEQTMEALSGSVNVKEESVRAEDDFRKEESEEKGDTDQEQEPEPVQQTEAIEEKSADDAMDEMSNTKETEQKQEMTETTVEETATEETLANPPRENYYIVKRGDSLVSISNAIYHTPQRVNEICSLNGIENMNMIYEGQKILLP